MKTSESTPGKKQLRLEDFQIQYKLGQGAYGYVFLASRNYEEFAIKEMSKYKLSREHREYLPIVQKQLLKAMVHPGVIKSHYAFQNTNNLYLVMEYCSGNQLLTIINNELLTESARRFYFAELVNIIEYLHSNGIVHRDLKPSNILLSREGHIKLIDFGTADITNSKLVSESFKEKINQMKSKKNTTENAQSPSNQKGKRILKRRSTFVGTTQFLSPQLVQFNMCGPASDMWALGCILYYTYYGYGPFSSSCEFQSYQSIKSGIIQYPPNKDVSQDALDLMKKLLVKNPEERLGSCAREDLSHEALNSHPFFKGLNIKEIFACEPPEILTPQLQIEEKLMELKLEANLSYKQPAFDNIFEKLLVKIDETNEGIYLCYFKKVMKLQEYEMLSVSNAPIFYHLKKDLQGDVAHLLSETKFSIGVFGRERLIYSSRDSKAICKRLNDYYSKLPEIEQKQGEKTIQV